MSIGKLIRDLRKERGLTQDELAKFAGVQFATLNRLENDRANVTIETLSKILDVFEFELFARRKQYSRDFDKIIEES
ncbi:MAG: helix-turn-helix transcriptional regulator [Bacteriovoracaceae bacterium]|nr:helix-turn-helix transcriptional regulator [Bacteriovoracaceae bacterium]